MIEANWDEGPFDIKSQFTCPYTGETMGLVPSRRLLKNGKRIVLWVHPDYVTTELPKTKR